MEDIIDRKPIQDNWILIKGLVEFQNSKHRS